jgi:hypothetical protein
MGRLVRCPADPLRHPQAGAEGCISPSVTPSFGFPHGRNSNVLLPSTLLPLHLELDVAVGPVNKPVSGCGTLTCPDLDRHRFPVCQVV